MVKGICRQVVLVRPGAEEPFEQAIFILKDNYAPVTDEELLKTAQRLVSQRKSRRPFYAYGAVWACGGALLTGVIWLMTLLI